MVRTMYSPVFIVKSAQNMRNRMSSAEGKLWERLSNGFDGARFRRQHPIGNHVVDFYCRKLKLIVEISRAGRPVPKERDSYLRVCGYSVLRISEKEINDDISRVIAAIGFRVHAVNFKIRLASVKNMFNPVSDAVRTIFNPRRRSHADTRRLGLLVEF
jgi:very-short-patch-repair endonuclease